MATKKQKTKGDEAANRPTKEIVDKANKLMALAVSKGKDDAEDEEGRTAAMTAALLMAEHNLVLVDKAAIDRARTYVEGIAQKAKDEKISNMAFGALLGVMFGKKLSL
jgi:hypothetical protein